MELRKIIGKIPFLSKALDSSKNYFPSAGPSDGDGPGWHSIGGFIDGGRNDYENAYGNITKISDAFSATPQYLIDANGKVVTESKILDVTYNPNRRMDAVKFRKALAVFRMVHDEFYLRVHYREGGKTANGKIRPDTIIGLTFIETAAIRMGGKLYFNLKSGETVDESEVLVFRMVNPYDLWSGFSPVRAARRWIRLDDYIADYQAGFFRNGAVPAGQFIITAKTLQEYKDIKKRLQERHRGAGKNDGVTYAYRPVDNDTGKPYQAQIEWVPFNSTNKDLALKDLLEGSTKKTDTAFGVPAEIRGFLQNSNYASVSVAEKIFVKYTLLPFMTALWSEFTHEMARVTGGFGAAFTFDLDIPVIADEEFKKAQKQKVNVEALKTLTEQGYTLESSVAALELPKAFLNLKVKQPEPDDDKPEVLQPGEASDADNVEQDDYETQVSSSKKAVKTKSPLPVPDGHTRCECCKGYGEHDTGFECYRCDAGGSVNSEEAKHPIPCAGRKDSPEVWIDSNGDYRHAEERKAMRLKVLSDEDRHTYESKLSRAIRHRMKDQVDTVIANLGTLTKAVSRAKPIEPQQDDLLADEMLNLLQELVAYYGQQEHEMGIGLLAGANVPVGEDWEFVFTDRQKAKYATYLKKVAKGYNAETAQAIREVLEDAVANGLPVADIKNELLKISDNEYRVNRLAVSEVNRAQNRASVAAMSDIQEQTGHKIVKILRNYGDDPCPLCRALEGREVDVDGSFWKLGEEVTDSNGNKYVNNFVSAETADLHPHCQCAEEYRVVKA